MAPDGMWSIGELAEHAGVTVKTVRFYSDRGLLPETGRSSGGHRRYGPEAIERLRLIRSLRSLDLPVPEVERVLDREDALEDVIDGQLRDIGSQLAALRWREAALQLLRDCSPEERADRLRLIGGMTTPPDTTALARFWRRVLPLRMPPKLTESIVDASVPQPPADPTPAQVLAFARLHALVTASGPDGRPWRPETRLPVDGFRPAELYEGLGEAYRLAEADLRGRRAPRGGAALDCFVDAYARSIGTRDTPDFRRKLSGKLAAARDPWLERYWRLAAELSPDPAVTTGTAHDWLRAALDDHVTD
ncbi:MerR family transcriptional regulator [Kitasatospora camelliae]|uniref:MerR family transcriptional regulator n=1 Tax=Kitasatospora camelliae TaxID=3156397 RepID=A0AAU8JX80_9ACTN